MSLDCEDEYHEKNDEEYGEIFDGVRDEYVFYDSKRICGICINKKLDGLIEGNKGEIEKYFPILGLK